MVFPAMQFQELLGQNESEFIEVYFQALRTPLLVPLQMQNFEKFDRP
jgi:hypothetical protein